MKKHVFAFDLDDTLVPNHCNYARRELEVIQYLIEIHPRLSHVHEIMDTIAAEDRRIMGSLGFSKDRFPTSLALGAQIYAKSQGVTLTQDQLEHIHEIGYKTFDRTQYTKLLDGARETLSFLQQQGHKILIITEGDEEIQTEKMQEYGLVDIAFPFVLPAKTMQAYAEISRTIQLDPAHITMVGNTLKKDIAPAAQAGYGTIYIPHEAWRLNVDPNLKEPTGPRHHKIKSLEEFEGVYQRIIG